MTKTNESIEIIDSVISRTKNFEILMSMDAESNISYKLLKKGGCCDGSRDSFVSGPEMGALHDDIHSVISRVQITREQVDFCFSEIYKKHSKID